MLRILVQISKVASPKSSPIRPVLSREGEDFKRHTINLL